MHLHRRTGSHVQAFTPTHTMHIDTDTHTDAGTHAHRTRTPHTHTAHHTPHPHPHTAHAHAYAHLRTRTTHSLLVRVLYRIQYKIVVYYILYVHFGTTPLQLHWTSTSPTALTTPTFTFLLAGAKPLPFILPRKEPPLMTCSPSISTSTTTGNLLVDHCECDDVTSSKAHVSRKREKQATAPRGHCWVASSPHKI